MYPGLRCPSTKSGLGLSLHSVAIEKGLRGRNILRLPRAALDIILVEVCGIYGRGLLTTVQSNVRQLLHRRRCPPSRADKELVDSKAIVSELERRVWQKSPSILQLFHRYSRWATNTPPHARTHIRQRDNVPVPAVVRRRVFVH